MLSDILTPKSKVLMIEVLAENPDEELNVTEIASRADIGRDAVYDHLHALVDRGILKEVGKLGNSPVYSINEKDKRALLLIELHRESKK